MQNPRVEETEHGHHVGRWETAQGLAIQTGDYPTPAAAGAALEQIAAEQAATTSQTGG